MQLQGRQAEGLRGQQGLSRNAKDISNRGKELYDKSIGFVTDLQKVEERIQQAHDCYNVARKKFSEGTDGKPSGEWRKQPST